MATKKMSEVMCQQIYREASEAGYRNANACTPTPMFVVERENPLDDTSPIVKQYAPVMGGVCGFAWVKVRPANSTFGNWLKKQGIVDHVSYNGGGYDIWISQYDQSMELKLAYAEGFAKVLTAYGINAYADSRMD